MVRIPIRFRFMVAVLACAVSGSFMTPTLASAEGEATAEAPMLLTNDHVGLSRGELAGEGAAEGAEGVEGAGEAATSSVTATGEPEVWAFDEPGEEPAPAGEEEPPVLAGAAAGAAPEGPAVDYRGCMERSIRVGNGFDESHRVCEAVFGTDSPQG
jgi:hypothetical protein